MFPYADDSTFLWIDDEVVAGTYLKKSIKYNGHLVVISYEYKVISIE